MEQQAQTWAQHTRGEGQEHVRMEEIKSIQRHLQMSPRHWLQSRCLDCTQTLHTLCEIVCYEAVRACVGQAGSAVLPGIYQARSTQPPLKRAHLSAVSPNRLLCYGMEEACNKAIQHIALEGVSLRAHGELASVSCKPSRRSFR